MERPIVSMLSKRRLWPAQLLQRTANSALITRSYTQSLTNTQRCLRSPLRYLKTSARAEPDTVKTFSFMHFLRGPTRITRAPFLRSRGFHTSARAKQQQQPSPNPTPHLGSPQSSPSLSQRFRKLSRDYGWMALYVYLGLSVLDFPFCLLAVRLLGVDRIGRWEHQIVGGAKDFMRDVGERMGIVEPQKDTAVGAEVPQTQKEEERYDWGVEDAERAAEKENACKPCLLILRYSFTIQIEKLIILPGTQLGQRSSLSPMPYTSPSSSFACLLLLRSCLE